MTAELVRGYSYQPMVVVVTQSAFVYSVYPIATLLTAIEIVARVPPRTWVPRESDSPRSPRGGPMGRPLKTLGD